MEKLSEQELQDQSYGFEYGTFCKWGLHKINRTVVDNLANFTSDDIPCDASERNDVGNDICIHIPTRIPGYTQMIFLYFSLVFAAAICFSYVIYSKERYMYKFPSRDRRRYNQ